MKLTWAQTKRLLLFVQASKSQAEHRLGFSQTEDERAFYRQIIKDATELLGVMAGDTRIEVELEEPDDEPD